MSPRPTWRQRGVTLVEMLVAMALLGLITIATVALYSTTQQSYRTVDSGQELNDSARYAFEVIGQALRIAGYQEYAPRDTPALAERTFAQGGTPIYPVLGFNNSTINSVSDATDFGGNNRGGINSSDTLAVRFMGVSEPTNPTTADGTMIDCQGISQPAPTNATDVALSLFWVRTVNGEPELSCISRGDPAAAGGAVRSSRTIVRGVESLQLMYGVDTDGDAIPNRWLEAQDISGATWAQVRAVRVGLIIRGAIGSSQGQSQTAADNTLYPLGRDFIGSTTTAGLSFAAPSDTRLRRAFTATFLLRNTL